MNLNLDLKDQKIQIILIVIVFAIALTFLYFLGKFLLNNPAFVQFSENFVKDYGLAGGFFITFIFSLWILPFPYEFLIAPFIVLYQPPWVAVAVFAIAAMIADFLNFMSGRLLGKYWIKKHIHKKVLDKTYAFFKKWGTISLIAFGIFGPVTSYDLLAFTVGGFSKMKLKKFMLITVVARTVHFLIIWALIDVFISLYGVVT